MQSEAQTLGQGYQYGQRPDWRENVPAAGDRRTGHKGGGGRPPQWRAWLGSHLDTVLDSEPDNLP